MIKLDAITEGMKFNGWADINFQNNYESDKMIKSYNFIYYINGQISVDEKLITTPAGDISNFIKSQSPILPPFLSEKFRHSSSHGLVYT